MQVMQAMQLPGQKLPKALCSADLNSHMLWSFQVCREGVATAHTAIAVFIPRLPQPFKPISGH